MVVWSSDKAIALDTEDVGFKSQRRTKFSKSFWIFLGHIISGVYPTRWPRVISNRFNREILTTRGVVSSVLPAKQNPNRKKMLFKLQVWIKLLDQGAPKFIYPFVQCLSFVYLANDAIVLNVSRRIT